MPIIAGDRLPDNIKILHLVVTNLKQKFATTELTARYENLHSQVSDLEKQIQQKGENNKSEETPVKKQWNRKNEMSAADL